MYSKVKLEPHIEDLLEVDQKTNFVRLIDKKNAYFEPFLFERKDVIKSKLYEKGIK